MRYDTAGLSRATDGSRQQEGSLFLTITLHPKPVTLPELPPIDHATAAQHDVEQIGIGEEASLSTGNITVRSMEISGKQGSEGRLVCITAARDFPMRLLAIGFCRSLGANASDDDALKLAHHIIHEDLPQISVQE